MVNTKIRLTILFAVEDGEAIYSPNKQANKKEKQQQQQKIPGFDYGFSSLLQNLGLN